MMNRTDAGTELVYGVNGQAAATSQGHAIARA
jgi:hypothetical protein